MTHQILIAGFGGQGVLFSGKFLAYAGMLAGKQVTWLPYYGPEMRGGTANVSVIISDDSIGSPVIARPTTLIAMNGPSFDMFEEKAAAGGKIFLDSTLVERPSRRTDADAFRIPATQLAADNGIAKLSNMIIIGKLIRETGICSMDDARKAMEKTVPARKLEMLEDNMKAIEIGYNYK